MRNKIGRNKPHDEHYKTELKRIGFRVMTVRKLQLKPCSNATDLAVNRALHKHTYLESFNHKNVISYSLGSDEKHMFCIVAECKVECREQ